MDDLQLALLVLLGLAVAAFVAVVRTMSGATGLRRNLLAISAMLVGAVWLSCLWDQLLLSRLLPFSSLIVLGNLSLLISAVLAGLSWSGPGSPVRRGMVSSAMLAAGSLGVSYPLLGTVPDCQEMWQGEICLQTSPWTCSPAAAATVLRSCGIDATEREMAGLCLTRRGTSWMGLYRGLSLKTAGTNWRPVVFDATPENLRQHSGCPLILSARLPESSPSRTMLEESCGWVPGQGHSVVFFEFLNDSTLVVGDPTYGRELWKLQDLQTLWTGRVIALVPRGPAAFPR